MIMHLSSPIIIWGLFAYNDQCAVKSERFHFCICTECCPSRPWFPLSTFWRPPLSSGTMTFYPGESHAISNLWNPWSVSIDWANSGSPVILPTLLKWYSGFERLVVLDRYVWEQTRKTQSTTTNMWVRKQLSCMGHIIINSKYTAVLHNLYPDTI